MKMKLITICCLLCMLFTSKLMAQDLLKLKDISTVKVDDLTNEEIINYKIQLQKNNITDAQAEQIALQRGMPATEIIKLRARLSKIDASDIANYKKNILLKTTNKTKDINTAKVIEGREVDSTAFNETYEKIKEVNQASLVFGSELFKNNHITFEPNLRIPTPKNYTIGPDDEIVIDLSGYQEVNYKLIVSPEGSVIVPYIGPILVSGLTLEQAAKRIREKMAANGYSSLNSGQSSVQVSVGKIRSIKVTVIGEAVKPGTYTLSSLASLFHALYASGGPTEKGSLRTIEVVRNSKIVQKFDAYDFITKGSQQSDIRLQDRDVVRIPIAENLIVLSGEVKKNAIYEALPNESLSQLLNYAGGFTANAYTSSLHIVQTTDKEKKIIDINNASLNNYYPKNGDIINVEKILERFENRVVIKGAVFRPGQYQLTENLTLKQLLQKADGLTEDAYVHRGIIERNKNNYNKEMLSFNPIEILKGKADDIYLEKNDEITIGSSADFKDEYTVKVEGEVKKPGEYPYIINQSLKDVIFKAGGFTDASSIEKIEIARRINNFDNDSLNSKLAKVISINTEYDLNTKGKDIILQPWDIVSVRTKKGYAKQIAVTIKGEINYPGQYVLSNKNDKVSNLLQRAGGLTPQAFAKAAYILRKGSSEILTDTSDIYSKKIQQLLKDTTATTANNLANKKIKIGLNLKEISLDENGFENIYLQEGDEIIVPKQKREIKVSGEVVFPTEVVYVKGQNLKYYIERAGGFTDNAKRSKTVVLQPNGVAAKTRRFLFFKKYPSIEEGSEIMVPKKPEYRRNRMTTGEIIGVTSASASLAGVVIAIINATKK